MRYAAAYVAAALVFAVIDGLWITLAGPRLYRSALGQILADRINFAPAAAFYLIYVAGIVVLAVAPALKAGGWTRAALLGAVLGLVAYGTYDLTNQATLKLWSTRVTLIDIAYGVVVSALAAAAGLLAARALRG